MKNEFINELTKIYELLTGKPTPDQEEEKQKELKVLLGRIVEDIGEDSETLPLAQEVQQIITDWDPLDFWFDEVEGLKGKMKELLEKLAPVEKAGEKAEKDKEESGSSLDAKLQGLSIEELKKMVAGDMLSELEELRAKVGTLETELQEKEKKIGETQEISEEDQKTPKKGEKKSSKEPKRKSKKLSAPKIMIPESQLGGAPQKAAEKPKSSVNVKAKPTKLKIKIKNPLKLTPNAGNVQKAHSSAQKPSAKPQIHVVAEGKKVSGPKISIPKSSPQKIKTTSQARPSSKRATKIKKVAMKPQSGKKVAVRPQGAPKISLSKASGKPGSSKLSIKPIKKIGAVSGKPKKLTQIGASPQSQLTKVKAQEKLDYEAKAIEQDKESLYAELDKEQLLNEWIFLQGKQYYYEISRKDLTKQHKAGKIGNGQYRGDLERLKYELSTIGSNLKEVRRRIKAM